MDQDNAMADVRYDGKGDDIPLLLVGLERASNVQRVTIALPSYCKVNERFHMTVILYEISWH